MPNICTRYVYIIYIHGWTCCCNKKKKRSASYAQQKEEEGSFLYLPHPLCGIAGAGLSEQLQDCCNAAAFIPSSHQNSSPRQSEAVLLAEEINPSFPLFSLPHQNAYALRHHVGENYVMAVEEALPIDFACHVFPLCAALDRPPCRILPSSYID